MAKRIELASNNDNSDYILGTDKEELHRLGLQHQVWAEEARRGWDIAEFGKGQTILDLGCGPGFVSRELAYIVGQEGKVVAVDMSSTYIDFLNQVSKLHQLNIETQCADFDHMVLEPDSLDGVFSRWALPWISNPEEIVAKIASAMRPGGVFVAHEYLDWTTHQTEPHYEDLHKAIYAAYDSLQDGGGDLNIGRRLPKIFYDQGLEVISTRPMPKLGGPDDLEWQWPASFYKIYFPKLVDLGYLTKEECDKALNNLHELELQDGALLFGPMMVEVIAVKI